MIDTNMLGRYERPFQHVSFEAHANAAVIQALSRFRRFSLRLLHSSVFCLQSTMFPNDSENSFEC